MTSSDQFVPAMSEIAREAGALLMVHFRRRIGFEYKGDVDLVTEADRASEALITDRIRARWPRHDLVGEEGARVESGSDYRWYIDPLDGTTNFAHGFPVFCVSLALAHQGQRIAGSPAPGSPTRPDVGRGGVSARAGFARDGVIVAGVIYDPTRDELFAAEQGSGAWLNQRRIHVSNVTHVAECLCGTGFPSHKRHQNPNIHFYHQITLRTHGVRRAGSAALDLASVAAGRLDAFWEFNLSPWDTAAGALLVEESGGKITDMAGAPWRLHGHETLASNGLIHADFVRLMQDIHAGRGLEPLPSPAEYAALRKLE